MILRLFKEVVFKQRTRKTQKYIECDLINQFAWATLTNLAQIHVIAIRN